MQTVAADPTDQIWITILCPAQAYRGPCRQMPCGKSEGGKCSLNGEVWAPVCVIPQSHPVHELRREFAAAEAEARRHLQ